jgi:hypothetical protein
MQKGSVADPGGDVVLTHGRVKDSNPRLPSERCAPVILIYLVDFRTASFGYDDAFILHGFILVRLMLLISEVILSTY